jgi:Ca2+-binding RTX toxin-like protein
LKTNAGNDIIHAGKGRDNIDAGADNDFINGGEGADVIDGGDGIDTVDYSDSGNSVTVNLATGEIGGSTLLIGNYVTATNSTVWTLSSSSTTLSFDVVGGIENLSKNSPPSFTTTADTLSNIENIIGSNYGDRLTGNDKDNIFTPGLSRVIRSGYDETTPTGYKGVRGIGYSSIYDIIDGGAGNDLLIVDYSVSDDGGAMNGGGKGDTGGLGRFNRFGAAGQSDVDNMDFTNIERLQVTGTSKNDTIWGGNGDDTINGGAGTMSWSAVCSSPIYLPMATM